MTKKKKEISKVNTLVRHKKLISLGIGCIAKEYPKHYTVNWGLDDSTKCLKSAVVEIDTSKCRTVDFHKYRSRVLMADPSLEWLNDVILGNVVQHFVGIGWQIS